HRGVLDNGLAGDLARLALDLRGQGQRCGEFKVLENAVHEALLVLTIPFYQGWDNGSVTNVTDAQENENILGAGKKEAVCNNLK
ncbi:MAG: hypothetical protein QM665_09775, partial [Desulfovibrio sp.]